MGLSMTPPYRGRAKAGCTTAFTLEPRIADLTRDTPLALPRIDTNDLPVTS